MYIETNRFGPTTGWEVCQGKCKYSAHLILSLKSQDVNNSLLASVNRWFGFSQSAS